MKRGWLIFFLFFVLFRSAYAQQPISTPKNFKFSSTNVLLYESETGTEIFKKNAYKKAPIASITKLMTAVVAMESGASLSELIQISSEDLIKTDFTKSKLKERFVLTRYDLLLIMLMSSDNRAAHAIARTSMDSKENFVKKMNEKALEIGMKNTFFKDPVGLSYKNVSTAEDLVRLVMYVENNHFLIKWMSTMPKYRVSPMGKGDVLRFVNTDRLVLNPSFNIGLSKTGYIDSAGRCIALTLSSNDKKYILVLLGNKKPQTREKDIKMVHAFLKDYAIR